MNKDDLIILIIALLLLAGMLITIFYGGARSRHGVGLFWQEKLSQDVYVAGIAKKLTTDAEARATSFS